MNKTFYFHLIIPALFLVLSFGCGTPQDGIALNLAPASSDDLAVEQFGAMREVMREGKTEARVRLVDVVATPHAYAVGALEGLTGEVMIVDGEVWVSRIETNGAISVTGPEPVEEDSATLLTVGHVSKWHSTTIETAVSGTELESLIRQIASAKGLDTERPFPFRIEGQLTNIDLHVINGYCPIATDPATEEKKPWRSNNRVTVSVNIVGFFAHNAVAVMTHHGTSVHAHAIVMVDDKKVMGHIDKVTVEPGMTLFVPEF